VTWIPLFGLMLTAFGMAVAQPVPLFVVAHRGASGYRPEHTLEAYRLAISMGADAIEPDLVITRDGVLIARHENEIGGTTDVMERFPDRRVTRVIDGKSVTGWFTEDFTLAEIRTLRARERLPFRSHEYDGRFGVPTFDEVLDLAASAGRETGRPIAVYPETKHPTYFRRLGLPLEDALLDRLNVRGFVDRGAPVLIQSFERPSLEYLRPRTRVRLVQLTSSPADVTPDRLAGMARYADGLGAEKTLIVPEGPGRRVLPPTTVVRDAHAAGLFVHAWTMRSEPAFLSPSYNGDPAAEVRQFIALGVDGVFTDFPDVAVRAARGADSKSNLKP
jgi:glycerophosphoryl diester phosphodiesterase